MKLSFRAWLMESVFAEETLEDRLKALRHFYSTAEIPFPAIATGKPLDDILVVLAGRKPLGMCSLILAKRDSIWPSASKRASEMGLEVRIIPEIDEVIVGQKDAVNKVEKLLKTLKPGAGFKKDASYHRSLGRLLGYPEKAITAFLQKTGLA